MEGGRVEVGVGSEEGKGGGGSEGEKWAGSEGCFQKADDNKLTMIVTICVVRFVLM